jgi:hypothetical protein
MHNPGCLKSVDLNCVFAGNQHTVHVTAPAELGDITSAKLWFTLRRGSVLVLRRRNTAAGGDDSQIQLILAGGSGVPGKFDVKFPTGLTAGLSGEYDYEIYIEIATNGYTIARGHWPIEPSIIDLSP